MDISQIVGQAPDHGDQLVRLPSLNRLRQSYNPNPNSDLDRPHQVVPPRDDRVPMVTPIAQADDDRWEMRRYRTTQASNGADFIDPVRGTIDTLRCPSTETGGHESRGAIDLSYDFDIKASRIAAARRDNQRHASWKSRQANKTRDEKIEQLEKEVGELKAKVALLIENQKPTWIVT